MNSRKLNATGRKLNRKAPSQQRVNYSQLEPRQLLASFVVNALADDGGGSLLTLREAITQAGLNSESDVISFASSLAGGTITLTQTQDYLPAAPEILFVSRGLIVKQDTITIDGANAPGLAISGNSQYRIFGITGTGNLTLRNITLEDGYIRGGDGGRGNTFAGSGGGGLGAGGAIFVSEQGTLTIVRSTIKDSQAIGGNSGTPDTSYSVWGHQKWGAGGGGMQGTGSDSKSNDDSGLLGGGPNQRVLTENNIKNSYNPDQFQGLIGAGAAGGPDGNSLSGGPTETCTFGSSSPAWQTANVGAAIQAGLKGDRAFPLKLSLEVSPQNLSSGPPFGRFPEMGLDGRIRTCGWKKLGAVSGLTGCRDRAPLCGAIPGELLFLPS